jgi:hypothetical protein
MSTPLRFLSALAYLFALSALADDAGDRARTNYLHNWPQWRGPMASGVAPQANPPLHWSETNHVRWKTPVPGKGHSSPIVFGDAVFVTAAIPVGEAQRPVYDSAGTERCSGKKSCAKSSRTKADTPRAASLPTHP